MIYNKSSHPIEVKKISVRIWSLRDEIEAALARRMKECEAAGVPLYIEDIKKFYKISPNLPENVVPLHGNDDGVTTLMEEISEDVKKEATEETKVDEVTDSEDKAPEADTSKVLSEAQEIIAEQTSQGLENKSPNPILDRPYTRQAPDLDKITYGFVLLSDLQMDQMLAFTKNKFLFGQSVIIEFLIPQNFIMTADVVYCHNYAMRSRIISSTKPDFRLQLRFTFSSHTERDTLRQFLKSIEPNLLGDKKNAKKDAAIEDDLSL